VAVNRTKVLEAAQKFLSKGQYDKAIAEYQKLVNEDPRDVRTLLKIGDLHTKRNKPKDAIDVYQKVAELYAKQGFFLKAVAVYKQILKLDASHIDSSQKLAKMYEELALTSDALTTYEQVADAYLAQGQAQKALETMERMVELDGSNIAVRIKYAEALSKAEKPKEAAKAFAEGAHLLKEQGRMDDYLRVVERQLYHDPDNLDIARELANLYLERQDPKRALAKLQVCFKADPRAVQTLEMLAEAFRQLGQIPKTVSVLKEIARLQAEVGAHEPRKRTLKRVLDLDPNDAEAREGLAAAPTAPAPQAASKTSAGTTQPNRPVPATSGGQPQRGSAGSATSLPAAGQASTTGPQAPVRPQAASVAAKGPPSEDIQITSEPTDDLDLLAGDDDDYSLDTDSLGDGDMEEEVLIVDDRTDQHAETGLPDLRVPSTNTARQPENKQERIARLLSDADAHEGYGLYDKVEELLKQVISIEPDHVPTHERLKDLYLATDRRVDAVRELLWLSDAWTDKSTDRAIQYARAAHDLAPHAAAAQNRLQALGATPEPDTDDIMFVDEKSSLAESVDLHARKDAGRADEAKSARSRTEHASVPRDARGATEDPLDIPISPDEFELAPPIPRASTVTPSMLEELLSQPMTPEDFERIPVRQERDADDGQTFEVGTQRGDRSEMDDLLDAPISPDEFDAPPPRVNAAKKNLQVGALLDENPLDDFGLADERFDRSGLIDVDSTEIGDAHALAGEGSKSSDAASALRASSDEPSVEFAEIGTGEIDVDEPLPLLQSKSKSDAFPEVPTGESDLLVDDDAGFPALPQPHGTKGAARDRLPARYAANDTSPNDSGPESTVPGAPIPDLIRQLRVDSSPKAAPVVPKPAAIPAVGKGAAQSTTTAKPVVPAPIPAVSKPAQPPSPAAKPAQPLPAAAPAPAKPAAAPIAPAAARNGLAASAIVAPPVAAQAPNLSSPETVARVAAAVPTPLPPADGAPDAPEIDETIDEAEFFASQGMMEEALELIQEALLIYRGNVSLARKLAEYEAKAEEQEANEEADARTDKAADDSFDIAQQLAVELGTGAAASPPDEMVDVDVVFAQFKKGVAAQIGLDDADTHFDLGIAYKEMGLTQDAIQEFEIAARSLDRACTAYTMIGMCFLEKGDAEGAVREFERALAAPHRSSSEETALHYEIGNAYEQLGEANQALAAFEKAAGQDRTFRGVTQRIEQLKRRRPASQAEDAEIDAALDDLLSGE
jgi:tetratricopeptide (TPR) repeat protein